MDVQVVKARQHGVTLKIDASRTSRSQLVEFFGRAEGDDDASRVDSHGLDDSGGRVNAPIDEQQRSGAAAGQAATGAGSRGAATSSVQAAAMRRLRGIIGSIRSDVILDAVLQEKVRLLIVRIQRLHLRIASSRDFAADVMRTKSSI